VLRVQDQLASNASIDRVRQLVEVLIRQNAEALRDAGKLRGQLAQAREQACDIRQRLHKAEQLTKIDALTSIANRRSLEEFLDREIMKSHREQSPLCVVMTDIDHFKKVNDNFGHQMGDDVLKSFARLLQSSARSSDLVARYGGEEFTLILPRTPMGNAYQITDRVRCTLDASPMASVESSHPLVKVTASFGIAEIREGEHAKQLLFRADRMLIDAKKKGRNLVVTDSVDRLEADRSA
jgi:diguanylate cyclase